MLSTGLFPIVCFKNEGLKIINNAIPQGGIKNFMSVISYNI